MPAALKKLRSFTVTITFYQLTLKPGAKGKIELARPSMPEMLKMQGHSKEVRRKHGLPAKWKPFMHLLC
eukprot:11167916-Lingulodinium_polyedra.AAC.1